MRASVSACQTAVASAIVNAKQRRHRLARVGDASSRIFSTATVSSSGMKPEGPALTTGYMNQRVRLQCLQLRSARRLLVCARPTGTSTRRSFRSDPLRMAIKYTMPDVRANPSCKAWPAVKARKRLGGSLSRVGRRNEFSGSPQPPGCLAQWISQTQSTPQHIDCPYSQRLREGESFVDQEGRTDRDERPPD